MRVKRKVFKAQADFSKRPEGHALHHSPALLVVKHRKAPQRAEEMRAVLNLGRPGDTIDRLGRYALHAHGHFVRLHREAVQLGPRIGGIVHGHHAGFSGHSAELSQCFADDSKLFIAQVTGRISEHIQLARQENKRKQTFGPFGLGAYAGIRGR